MTEHTERDFARVDSVGRVVRGVVLDPRDGHVGDLLVVTRSAAIAMLVQQREELLREFEALARKWHQTGLGIDCCECSMDHYDCGNELDAVIAKLRAP